MKPIQHTRRLAAAATVALGLLAAVETRAEVAESATEIQPRLIGAEVPAATVRTLEGEAVSLPELVRGEKSILIFYRGGW